MKTAKKILLLYSFFFCLFTPYYLMGRCKKPKDIVSYATVLFLNEKLEVLLLKRKGTGVFSGQYSLPGGKIEEGETVLEAAKREALEEVGVEARNLHLIHVVNRQGPSTEFYVFVFAAEWDGSCLNVEKSKCESISWFNVANLPENIIPAHKQAIDLSQRGIMYSEHGWEQRIK